MGRRGLFPKQGLCLVSVYVLGPPKPVGGPGVRAHTAVSTCHRCPPRDWGLPRGPPRGPLLVPRSPVPSQRH